MPDHPGDDNRKRAPPEWKWLAATLALALALGLALNYAPFVAFAGVYLAVVAVGLAFLVALVVFFLRPFARRAP